MNLNSDEQILIVEQLAAICGNVPECGEIVPAPTFFTDKEDFNKSIGNISLTGRKARETSDLALLVISFSKPPAKPQHHGGWWTYNYKFYLFRQYDNERLDESITPDEFRKKILKSYFEFVNAILGIQTKFGDRLPLVIDSDRILECDAYLENSDDFIDEYEKCDYVPGVRGFSVNLPVEVKVRFGRC